MGKFLGIVVTVGGVSGVLLWLSSLGPGEAAEAGAAVARMFGG